MSTRAAASRCLLLTCALLLPLVVSPDGLPAQTLCLFHRLTGLPCPACGLTHAWLAAGRGEWRLSWAWHPLGPAAWMTLLWLWAESAASWAGWGGRCRLRAGHLVVVAGLLLAVWILRLAAGGVSLPMAR